MEMNKIIKFPLTIMLVLAYSLLLAQGASSSASSSPAIDIYYHVPFIPQPTGASCWSTSIAMILWWRDNEDAQASLADALTPAQVALNIGYWRQHFSDRLPRTDSRPLDYWGFEGVAPSSFTPSTLAGWLDNGPMWAAYFGCANPVTNCGHAVALVGMRGDGTPDGTVVIIHDPDDGTGVYPNLGVRDRQMSFTEFVERLNNRALNTLPSSGVITQQVNFLAYLKHR